MTAALALAVILQTDPVKVDIDLAVRLWKEFKMPIPPSTALPKISIDEKGYALTFYGMVDFRSNEDYVIYSGTRQSKNAIDGYSKKLWSERTALPTTWRMFSVNTILKNGRFPESPITSTAVQSACIGQEPLAKQLVELAKNQSQPFDSYIETWIGAPVDNSVAAHVAFLIYCSYLNAILDGSVDRKEILDSLIRLEQQHLIKVGPPHHLNPGRWGIKDRIKELRATLNQPKAEGNPIQEAVNELINLRLEDSFHADLRKEPICLKILGFGKDAVPYLKEELKHSRITRTLIPTLGNNLTQIMYVKSIAEKLTKELSTQQI